MRARTLSNSLKQPQRPPRPPPSGLVLPVCFLLTPQRNRLWWVIKRQKTRLTRVWSIAAFLCRCEQTRQSIYKKYRANAWVQSLFETYARRVEVYLYFVGEVIYSEFFSLCHLLRWFYEWWGLVDRLLPFRVERTLYSKGFWAIARSTVVRSCWMTLAISLRSWCFKRSLSISHRPSIKTCWLA